VDITEEAGLSFYPQTWPGVAVVDIDGDDVLDILVAGGQAGLGLFLGRGDLTFEAHPQPEIRGVIGFASADIDGDGQAEVAILGEGLEHWITWSDGELSTRPIGETVDGDVIYVSAAFGDIDGDGQPDLYTGGYWHAVDGVGPANHLRLGQVETNSVWPDVATQLGADLSGSQTLAVSLTDIDSDGLQEIVAAPDYGPLADKCNAVLAPGSDGQFEDIAPQLALDHSLFAMDTTLFDADRDGDLDLYITNIGANVLAIANGGDFSDEAELMGVDISNRCEDPRRITSWPFDDGPNADGEARALAQFADEYIRTDSDCPVATSWSAIAMDFDQDGLEDLYVTNGAAGEPQIPEASVQSDVLLWARPSAPFEDISACSGADLDGDGRGAVAADLDGDGDLDLVTANATLDSPAYGVRLFRNDGARGDWLQVRLRGHNSTPDGLGARLVLRQGDRIQVREMTTSAGFASTGPALVHFGLGEDAAIDSLEVHWPSGQIDRLSNVQGNTHLVIEEGSTP